jgi:hypothetical protein
MLKDRKNRIKIFLSGVILSLVLLSPLIFVPTVQAQQPAASGTSAPTPTGNTSTGQTSTQGSAGAQTTGTAPAPTAAKTAENWSLAAAIRDRLMDGVGKAMLNVSASFTWMGGRLLDASLDYSVFQMGTKILPLNTTIETIWSLIRDMSNLVFIFGFIYVGIRTIIDPDSVSPKKMLAQIIIGALLINFSLFFVRIIKYTMP